MSAVASHSHTSGSFFFMYTSEHTGAAHSAQLSLTFHIMGIPAHFVPPDSQLSTSDHSSISRGCGLRVCLMVVPSSDGLKGCSAPYGFGIPMSSGM